MRVAIFGATGDIGQQILDSDLDWTLVRPPRVVNGRASGDYDIGMTLEGRSVTKGDLAQAIVGDVAEAKWVRQAPFISSRRPS